MRNRKEASFGHGITALILILILLLTQQEKVATAQTSENPPLPISTISLDNDQLSNNFLSPFNNELFEQREGESESEYLERLKNVFNQVMNDALRRMETNFNLPLIPQFDVSILDWDNNNFSMIGYYLYHLNFLIQAGEDIQQHDYHNWQDLKVHTGQQSEFRSDTNFLNDPDRILQNNVDQLSYYPENLALFNRLFNFVMQQSERKYVHRIFFGDRLATHILLGRLWIDMTQPPNPAIFDAWLHELTHSRMPHPKMIVRYEGDKNIATGYSLATSLMWYQYMASVFSNPENADYIRERFQNAPGDMTFPFIVQNGGNGFMMAMNEWVAMIEVDALTIPGAYEAMPPQIQEFVRVSSAYLFNARYATRPLSPDELFYYRDQIISMRPILPYSAYLPMVNSGNMVASSVAPLTEEETKAIKARFEEMKAEIEQAELSKYTIRDPDGLIGKMLGDR